MRVPGRDFPTTVSLFAAGESLELFSELSCLVIGQKCEAVSIK